MRRSATVQIDGTAEAVWRVLVDVERWPEWTPTMREVQLLDAAELRPGAHVRISQPKLPILTWVVDEMTPERGFSWTTGPPGGRARATHYLEPVGDHATRVDLALEQTGVAGMFGLLTARMTQHYLDLEGASLRATCESKQ